MKFTEIADAVESLVAAFGHWDWELNGKKLKAWRNRDTFDYGFMLIENGLICQNTEHAGINQVAQCLIEWVKGENIANYD